MARLTRIAHSFVEHVPTSLEEGTLYVSVEFGTAVHLCCCGCGSEVVTPLTPVDWKLVYDGEAISLDPSIGNWSFACRSHYWIERNRVHWARSWSDEEIAENREADRISKTRFFSSRREIDLDPGLDDPPDPSASDSNGTKSLSKWWSRFRQG